MHIILIFITSIVFAPKLQNLVVKDSTDEYQKTDEYEKLTIEGRALYDGKQEAIKWAYFPPLALSTFGASMASSVYLFNEGPWDFPPALLGISIFSLGGPYYFLKLGRENIESVSQKEIELYKKTYTNEFKKLRLKYLVTSSALTGSFSYLIFIQAFDRAW